MPASQQARNNQRQLELILVERHVYERKRLSHRIGYSVIHSILICHSFCGNEMCYRPFTKPRTAPVDDSVHLDIAKKQPNGQVTGLPVARNVVRECQPDLITPNWRTLEMLWYIRITWNLLCGICSTTGIGFLIQKSNSNFLRSELLVEKMHT